MKNRFLIILCAVAGFLSLAASEPAVAGVSWSVTVFDGPLGGCGHWIERPGYGRCWYPAYVSSDWRPYCEGYWMWTNSGWYWVSNEQWAWATYHYGRWDYDSYYGWVWVPGTEWGPSWVSWRQGDEYVGWAPLPPGAGFGPDGYIVVRDRPIQDRFFVFVGIGHFSEPIHRRTVIVNKTTIINKTVSITNITRVNNVVVNNGPKVETIQKVSARKLTEPPPHVATTRAREQMPNAPKPLPREQVQETRIHEPEVVHGSPGSPQETTGSRVEPEKKQAEKQPEKQYAGPPLSPNPPQYEKNNQPHSEKAKEEAPKKSESRQDEGQGAKSKKNDSPGN